MKHAMVNSALGDDGYNEDPTVNVLEAKIAIMLGKQAALFVPSGTMSNLIAGGVSHLAAVVMTTLKNKSDGTIDLDEFENYLKNRGRHAPIALLAAVENTHNACGGKVLPLQWLDDFASCAKKYALALHMDGARIFNAAEYLKVPAKRIVRDFDTVSVCFSKGLSAPVGSVLVGSYHFIEKARRIRQMLGGGMRQAGVLAAAALVALDETVPRLGEDHKRAQTLAKALNSLNLKSFNVDIETVHTNIVLVEINPNCSITGAEVCQRLGQISLAETHGDCRSSDGEGIILKAMNMSDKNVRFVLHREITDADLWLAIKKLTYVLREFDVQE
ncbi:Probable low-specificity L-threonine aldolase 2 [Eumeta japonica]|uniref:Probable low-specificity L-threonine aldolase 2 n=1 Tax=Eumeta variegata TaxID=151549 RepID=A0A4C1Y7Y0_EUMVA|nr:Probable low-specificity L-threonine aldolase 2 [Eumeta japonica]